MVDMIVILLLLVGFVIGWKRGLFKQIMRFVGSILAMIIAYALAETVSPLLRSFIPFPNLGNSSILNIVLSNGIVENAFYNAIAFVITFIIAKIIISILTSVLNVAARIPVLKQVNSLAGGVFGLVETFLFVFVVLLVASLLPIGAVQAQMEGSILAGFIVNKTPYISGMLQNLLV